MLYLVQASISTVHSPGDDGMTGPFFKEATRIVEAENDVEAESKFRKAFEREEPYSISISCDDVQVHPVIR